MYNMQAEYGETVKVHYVGTLTDGSIFDSSIDRGDPMIFEVGDPSILPEFSKTVVGMRAGEKRTVTIQPSDAYGEINRNLFRIVAPETFENSEPPEIGTVVTFELEGDVHPAMIHQVIDAGVVINFNHPLAGQILNFEIELLTREVNNTGEQTIGESNQNDNETGQD